MWVVGGEVDGGAVEGHHLAEVDAEFVTFAHEETKSVDIGGVLEAAGS